MRPRLDAVARVLSCYQWQLGFDLRPGVACGLSLLMVSSRFVLRVFLRVLRFSSLHKKQHLQFDQDHAGPKTS